MRGGLIDNGKIFMKHTQWHTVKLSRYFKMCETVSLSSTHYLQFTPKMAKESAETCLLNFRVSGFSYLIRQLSHHGKKTSDMICTAAKLDFQPFWESVCLSSSHERLNHWSVSLVRVVTSAFYANYPAYGEKVAEFTVTQQQMKFVNIDGCDNSS